MEHRAWEFLGKLLDALGEWGMSSESSDGGEGIEEVYRVKLLPWRKDVTKELDYIDSERRFAKKITSDQNDEMFMYGFSSQGTKPPRRVRGIATNPSERYPRAGLPIELYDPEYFKNLSATQAKALSVSRDQFEWLELMVNEAHRG